MLISQDGLGLEGDCHETFQVPIEVREMDLADRYLNTQCVRQDWDMARNGKGISMIYAGRFSDGKFL